MKEQLNNELVTEQKAKEAAQSTIEALEKSLEELREEKNQLILTKMNDGQDEERQNFFRLLHQEKVSLIHIRSICKKKCSLGSTRTTSERTSKTIEESQ